MATRPESVSELILTHVRRYPICEIADIYKLLHQGVFGPGHSIPNRKAAREWLEQESGLHDPDASGPLFESVHPEGAIVRVHVRPYLALGGRLNALLEAYIRSGELVQGDAMTMSEWWTIFEAMIESGGLLAGRFDRRSAELTRKIHESDQWAAVHHSPAYISRYKPVYRILTSELAQGLSREQALPFELN